MRLHHPRWSPALLLTLLAILVGSPARATPRCTADEAALALSQSQQLRDPGSLYRFYRRFGHCDDGAASEGVSEAIARLLVDHRGGVGALDRFTRGDRKFRAFVVKHVDATLDAGDLQTIVGRTRHDCPPVSRRFCALIERAAIDAQFSPAMLRAEIAAHGAKAVVNRLWNSPVERPGEDWLAVEEHIAGGSDEWLGIAGELAAGTDAGASHGLIIALHHALAKNPEGVLRTIPHLPFTIQEVCGDGDDEATPQHTARELRAALSAIDRVTAPELRARREQCGVVLAESLQEVTRPVPQR